VSINAILKKARTALEVQPVQTIALWLPIHFVEE
jgi:hypothetical protein